MIQQSLGNLPPQEKAISETTSSSVFSRSASTDDITSITSSLPPVAPPAPVSDSVPLHKITNGVSQTAVSMNHAANGVPQTAASTNPAINAVASTNHATNGVPQTAASMNHVKEIFGHNKDMVTKIAHGESHTSHTAEAKKESTMNVIATTSPPQYVSDTYQKEQLMGFAEKESKI